MMTYIIMFSILQKLVIGKFSFGQLLLLLCFGVSASVLIGYVGIGCDENKS